MSFNISGGVNAKKNIIFLDQYGSLGGGQQVLLELVKSAIRLGHEATVVIPSGPCSVKLINLGAKVVTIPECNLSQGYKSLFDLFKFALWSLHLLVKLIKVIKNCDLIYVNGPRLLPVTMILQFCLRKICICHVHINHNRIEQSLILKFFKSKLTKAVVVPSQFIRSQLIDFNKLFNTEKLIIVENGLNERFANITLKDRFSNEKLENIGIIGRVSPEKGHDILPRLAKDFPEFNFHVLGDAAFSNQDFYENLKRISPPNIIWHGWVDELPSKVDALHIQIALVPSRTTALGQSFESFSLTTYEMTALSCLVIVPDLGVFKDVANELKLQTFSSTDDLCNILRDCQQYPGEYLAKKVSYSWDIVMAKYDNRHFAQRLDNLLTYAFSG